MPDKLKEITAKRVAARFALEVMDSVWPERAGSGNDE